MELHTEFLRSIMSCIPDKLGFEQCFNSFAYCIPNEDLNYEIYLLVSLNWTDISKLDIDYLEGVQ